ncbi:transglycosylase domain-containing protein [Anaerolineales bacterium HSG6]|nr:transglycosylase domain-containing protein [Anaerolineales bacterium HSG6]
MQINRKVMITRRRRRRLYEQKPKIYLYVMNFLLLILAGLVAVFLVTTFSAVGAAYSVYDSFAQQLPDPTAIETEQEDFETTKIYDRTGTVLLYELFDPLFGDRSYVTLSEIPEFCREATVILEDKTFYTNLGFDPEGIGRAFWLNLQGGDIQGGSSITQQLIKNILIAEEERTQKSYTRKVKEIILSTEITRRFEKDQILEWYFNTNFYGNLAYGIDAAARVYFDKPVSALTDAECAMLAPIPQYPFLNPVNSLEKAKFRQKITFNRMEEEGAITAEESESLYNEKLQYREENQDRFDIIAPHFAVHVRKELDQMYEPELIYRGGLRVFSTIDLDFHLEVQKIAKEQIEQLLEDEHNASNACVVSIRPRTGEILALVGSIDYWDEDNDGNVNVCTANPGRQPGSSFKPFSYLTLFSQGKYNPATMVMDVRQSFPDNPNPPYVPENYDRAYHGPVRLRNSLARSYNIPAVWVLHKAGVKNVINTAQRLGITTLNEDYYGLALTLGGGEVKPIDIAYAYSVLANMGTMSGQSVPEVNRRPGHRTLDPVSILRVEDKEGEVIYQYTEPETEQVVDPALAYMMNDIMSDNNARAASFGLHSDLKQGFEDRPIAAKTGTTNNFRDNWTVGFTPQLATAVWVGNNDNEPMEDVTGLSGAAPIWNAVMQYYHEDKPVQEWEQPQGIVERTVDGLSGLLPTEHSNYQTGEIFLAGAEPTEKDNIHRMFQINRENGKLATTNTPPELIEERVYEVYPPVAEDWIRENEIPLPPTEYDDTAGAASSGPVAIMQPRPYQYVKEQVVISGNVQTENFQLYRVEYGAGLNPTEWQQVGGDHGEQVISAPLENWDTAPLSEGLYTLQLTAVRGDQSIDRKAIQVTVDNTSPEVFVVNPEPDKQYIMEDNEWINFQVEAVDNFSMNRVEFFMDNEKIGETTVTPYTLRWNIEMIDRPVTAEPPVTEVKTVLAADGTMSQTEIVTLSQVLPLTVPLTDPEAIANLPPDTLPEILIGYKKVFSGGLILMSLPDGTYTETHLIHVVAYDSAGNETKSPPFYISVAHEEEEDEDEEEEEGYLLPKSLPHNEPSRDVIERLCLTCS